MPAYNAGKYIAQAIDTIIRQTYTHWELIIVNDGSTDNTEACITQFTDPRIKLINMPNRGAASARNTAYQHAAGSYIMFFDADDYIPSNFISTQLARLSGEKNAIVLADWARFYGNDTKNMASESILHDEMSADQWIREYWYQCNPMTNPGRALIPHQLIEKAGGWDETLSLNDDLEFFTRIMLKADKILFNHEALLGYRSGIGGLSALKGTSALQSLFNSIHMATSMALASYGDQKDIRRCCANMWQNFIYTVYPAAPQLVSEAYAQIRQLEKPDFSFPAGGITKILVNILGWKAVSRLKMILKVS
jgi:hypothetical protein